MATATRPKPLFSRTLRPGDKVLFVDVYEGRTGTPYVSVCDNRKDKDGNYTRARIFLDPVAVPELRDALTEVTAFLLRYTPKPKAPPA